MDNNATTRTAPEVVEAMLPLFSDLYGNASSMHSFGGQMQKYMDQARGQVAALIGAQPDEIIFTSCGTESDSSAIYSALETQPEKKHFITTSVEHPAVMAWGAYLEKKGYEVTYLPVNSVGQLDLDQLRSALRDDTALVSIMYANNETGTIFPMAEVSQIVKEKGVLLHVDAVQAVGKEFINLAELPVDFLSLSGHKLHAPKGIGVLYLRRGTKFSPFLRGGHQEKGRRAGTENVPYIVGLGKACELALSDLAQERVYLSGLRDKLEQGIISAIPYARVNGDREHRLVNTSNIAFEAIEGEAILLRLNQYGICASSGSACTSGSLEPSHVMMAMGVPFTCAHGSIRFSLSRYNTEEEVDQVIKVFPPIVETLRKMSPFTPKG